MSIKRTTQLLASSAIALALIAAVSGISSDSGASFAKASGGSGSLAYVAKDFSDGGFQNESDGAEKAAKSGGFALDIMDGRGDKNIQQFNIDTALVRGAEGLILVTQDQKLGPVVAAQLKGASFPHLNITDLQGLS